MLKDIQKALLTGISYILPFLVIVGMLIAITGMFIEYVNLDISSVIYLREFAWIVMDFMPAIFAAYVAYEIGDKIAIAPGFIGGYLANNPIIEETAASGFLGAILMRLFAGYLIAILKKVKTPELLESLKKSLFIPVITAIIIFYVTSYPLAYSIGLLNEFAVSKIIELSRIPECAFLVGAILSAMCVLDMGGSLDKLALLSVFALWSDPNEFGFVLNTAISQDL